MDQRPIESLSADLKAIKSQITGRDISDAGIVFGKDPLTPLTQRALETYLSGNGTDPELAAKLLEFFQERAREYEELEQRRREKMQEQRSNAA